MTYRVDFKRSAERELNRLPEALRTRVLRAIGSLRADPRPQGTIKLKGSVNAWRIRVGAYRVLYTIDDGVRIVLIQQVGDRKDIYR